LPHALDPRGRGAIKRGFAGEGNTQIAIDGPAGSGKTTTGRLLARRLGSRFLDTGIMYRAATRLAHIRSFSLDDEGAIIAGVEHGALEFIFDPAGDVRVMIDGVDETESMHTPAIDHDVSAVSALPLIRPYMVRLQREVAGDTPIVMVGRDIGTVVLKDIKLRDERDSNRKSSPLRAAEDCIQVHTDGKCISAVVDEMELLARRIP
jgi:CMP/dCMP kinase